MQRLILARRIYYEKMNKVPKLRCLKLNKTGECPRGASELLLFVLAEKIILNESIVAIFVASGSSLRNTF